MRAEENYGSSPVGDFMVKPGQLEECANDGLSWYAECLGMAKDYLDQHHDDPEAWPWRDTAAQSQYNAVAQWQLDLLGEMESLMGKMARSLGGAARAYRRTEEKNAELTNVVDSMLDLDTPDVPTDFGDTR